MKTTATIPCTALLLAALSHAQGGGINLDHGSEGSASGGTETGFPPGFSEAVCVTFE